MVEKVL